MKFLTYKIESTQQCTLTYNRIIILIAEEIIIITLYSVCNDDLVIWRSVPNM